MAATPSKENTLPTKTCADETASVTTPANHDTQTPIAVVPTNLVHLLEEPEVKLIMRADRVDERELLTMLSRISSKYLKNAAHSEDSEQGKQYRPGVGIVLINRRGEVFVGQRIDQGPNSWQLPQGGIARGEDPRRAALRELMEEIGSDNVEVVAESRDWLTYDVPSEPAQNAWRGRWRGQRQKWFVMLFKGQDSDLDVATEHPEFSAWRWVPRRELPKLAVPFKRDLYQKILTEFETVFSE